VDASDLNESEILRIARNARTDAKASKTITTPDEQSPSKPVQHGELATLKDIEQALGLAGNGDIDRAATKTLQQECQLPCDPVHHDSFDETPAVSKESLEPAEQHACPSDVLTGYRRMRTKKADPARMTGSHHTKGIPKARAKGKANGRAKGKAQGKAKGKASGKTSLCHCGSFTSREQRWPQRKNNQQDYLVLGLTELQQQQQQQQQRLMWVATRTMRPQQIQPHPSEARTNSR